MLDEHALVVEILLVILRPEYSNSPQTRSKRVGVENLPPVHAVIDGNLLVESRFRRAVQMNRSFGMTFDLFKGKLHQDGVLGRAVIDSHSAPQTSCSIDSIQLSLKSDLSLVVILTDQFHAVQCGEKNETRRSGDENSKERNDPERPRVRHALSCAHLEVGLFDTPFRGPINTVFTVSSRRPCE